VLPTLREIVDLVSGHEETAARFEEPRPCVFEMIRMKLGDAINPAQVLDVVRVGNESAEILCGHDEFREKRSRMRNRRAPGEQRSRGLSFGTRE
jgi:hypothetical protein